MRKLDLAAKAERDELADDDAESPGGEDRIKRAIVEWPDHQPFDQQADHRSGDEGERKRKPRIEAEGGGDKRAIGADG